MIENCKSEILEKLKDSTALLISGPTGCGKSTVIPVLLYNEYSTSKICLVQPRRIAVYSIYTYLSQKIECRYRMRYSSGGSGRLCIMTDGIFLNELAHSENMNYDYIILDEVHERSLRMDGIFSILKEKMKKGLKAKILLMSATMSVSSLKTYFDADVFEYAQRKYHAEVFYEKEAVQDYITECYRKIKSIVKGIRKEEENFCLEKIKKSENPEFNEIDEIFQDFEENVSPRENDILVFLPGEEDINDLYAILKRIPAVLPLKIHSTLSESEQSKIFQPSERIKVILSTNICETSITVPGISCVIDCGLEKMKVFDGINRMGIKKISKESAEQRKGRSNRLRNGTVYRIYTEEEYNTMEHYQPEIYRSDLSSFLLLLIQAKIDILTHEFVDSPPLKNVKHALHFLINIKAIEFIDEKFKITKYGKELTTLPLEAKLGNFLLLAKEKNCLNDGILLCSLLSQETYSFLPKEKAPKLPDIPYLLELIEAYKITNNKQNFCIKFEVPLRGMEKALEIIKDLKNRTTPLTDFFLQKNTQNKKNILSAFQKAFSHNTAKAVQNHYQIKNTKEIIHIHPTSYYFKNKTKNIIFHDALCTHKTYAKIISKKLDP